MSWNISTINAWKPGSHCIPKKSKNTTLKFLDFFFLFFFLIFQMAVDCIKMIFQTPNKGLTCFKHYKFLIFDEKQLQQGLEIHGLEKHGPWRYTVFNWFPKHLRYTDFGQKPWRYTVFDFLVKKFMPITYKFFQFLWLHYFVS